MSDSEIERMFQSGVRRHGAGDLAGAEPFYRGVLALDPRHSGALHLLGVLALQGGRGEAALALIDQAIAICPAAEFYANRGLVLASLGKRADAIASYRLAIAARPNFPEAHCNLANALKESGCMDAALAAYRRAIELRPEFAEAHNNLGLALFDSGGIPQAIAAYRRAITIRPEYAEPWNNLGNALHRLKDFAEAIRTIERALELKPGYPEAHNNLGAALKEAGRWDEAAAAFERALSLRPGFPEAHNNVGLLLHARGDAAAAIRACRHALELRPDFSEAHYNLALALRSSGDVAQSIEHFRRALALRADWPEAWNNLGIALHEVGQSAGAGQAMMRALALRPDYAEAHGNLGNVLRQSGRLAPAIASYRRAIALAPECAEAHSNLGDALKQAGRFEEAIAAFRRALTINPNLPEAHNNLGNVHKDQGELDEAIACYERAAALSPHDASVDSNRIYTLYFHPNQSPRQILREHLRWDQRHAHSARRAIAPHGNDPSPMRRLRIGYVSPDFRDHCQSLFTLPLLANHDHSQFEVFCYSDVAAPDAITAQIQGHAGSWRPIAGLSDERAAGLIRADGIDVLIDLTMHMAHNRMLVFARKPAPVQVTWLAYPGTTGLAAMDYRLSDPYLDPPGDGGGPGPHDHFYTEKTIRLAESFWCYGPSTNQPPVNELPALGNGHVTFGCLNNFCKVSDPALSLWARVLEAVPDSRLLLLAPAGPARERVLGRLRDDGIDPARIEFSNRMGRPEYLKLYHRIDLCLDTFPYNGHTTTLDGLWMGVPAVTLVGRNVVGRGGWSQLCNLGLRQFAAHSEPQFVRIAAGLAHDLDRLRRLRSTLRGRLRQSPLMNAPRFARNVESAYRLMWAEWAQGPRRFPLSA